MAQSKVSRETFSEPPARLARGKDKSWIGIALEEISDSVDAKQKLARECVEDIVSVAQMFVHALRESRKIAFFGNGGSAADAQHLAAEFVGRFAALRPPMRSLAFTTNTSILTAVGNDFGFDEIFSRQVRAHIDEGDVVVGISTSGRSKNVVNGIREAKEIGATTVALTGGSGGDLAELSDYCVNVPSSNTQRIQECHILIGHILCGLVETKLARNPMKQRPSLRKEHPLKTVEIRHPS